jgi:putative transposase
MPSAFRSGRGERCGFQKSRVSRIPEGSCRRIRLLRRVGRRQDAPFRLAETELERWLGRSEQLRVHGTPACIVSDNGTEPTSKAILKWANDTTVEWQSIDTGKPQQNGCIGSFNGSLRDECPNEESFDSPADARRKLALWR